MKKAGKKTSTPRASRKKNKGSDNKPRGCLDAAAQLLAASSEPMRCKDLIETMLSKGLWKTAGKTPAATLSSAIIREIAVKKTGARFKKVGRGLFAKA